MLRNIAFETVGKVSILVHGVNDPTNDEWKSMCDDLSSDPKRKNLVITLGGSPSALQRARVKKAYDRSGVNPRTATLTESPIARGIITVFGWLGANIKGFGFNEFDNALYYLGVRWSQIEDIERTVSRLMLDIGATEREVEDLLGKTMF